jgi:alkaline phosphatase
VSEVRPSGGIRPVTAILLVALAALATYFATRRFAFVPSVGERRIERTAVATRGVSVAPAPPELAEAPVRNVILLIGDGMGTGQIVAGRTHTRGPDGRLRFERFPVTGLVSTHAANDLVTKSDASATALATGRKTNNGRVGTDVDGRPLRTLLEAARDAGWATGMVTTTRITDATPAAFAAHVAERPQQNEIAEQLVAARIDLLAGGGRAFFLPRSVEGSRRQDDRDLIAEAAGRGVTVVGDAAALDAATTLPLYALFDVDPQNVEGRVPSVGSMAAKSIELLAASGRPFFVMIEEEEIDSAAHKNDVARLGAALERFDEAAGAAVDFAARDGRTLVLVTGDHSTAAPAVDDQSTATELVVVWESDDHTGEPIPVYAYGPPSAARRFSGTLDNTEIPGRIAAALGLAFPPSPGGATTASVPGPGEGLR